MVDLELKKLDQFYGTLNYYDLGLYQGILVTDGIKYVMENGYSWFVTDALAVIAYKFRNEDFLSIKLKLDKEKAECDHVIEDGNHKELHRQHYGFTDAKRELTLWYANGVLYLPSEH